MAEAKSTCPELKMSENEASFRLADVIEFTTKRCSVQ